MKITNKKIVSLVAVLALSGCVSPMQQADNEAKLKKASTPVEEKVTTPFDEKQAKTAMQEGSATIKGVLYHKVSSGGKYAGEDPLLSMTPARFLKGVKVWLYPETAHLNEMLKLESKNRRSRVLARGIQLKHYVPDPRLYQYRLEATTDANGRYFFYKMKPGRYYVVAQNQKITSNGSEPVLDGVAVVSNGFGVPVGTVQQYRNQDFRIDTPVAYGEFVEIKSGQKELTIESRMRYTRGIQ